MVDSDRPQLGVIWAVEDITDMVRLTTELRELARTDDLTGLANRRAFSEAAEGEFQRCRRFGSVATVLMIDIDHFKPINDTYGHQVGDEVLVALATILKRMARATDLPARFGGEEFVLLLVGTDLAGAAEMAERIRLEVARHVVTSTAGEIRFTVSIGIASFAEESWTAAIRKADQAMYRGKESGRNRVVVDGEEGTAS
jgi:diguanylate cyclase (GGDEF)-like protein